MSEYKSTSAAQVQIKMETSWLCQIRYRACTFRCHLSVNALLFNVSYRNLDVAAGIASLSFQQPELNYFRFRRRQSKFGTAGAHFGVGQYSTRLYVLENLGITAGISRLYLAYSLICKYSGFNEAILNFVANVHI
jgi:hypothetical protein